MLKTLALLNILSWLLTFRQLFPIWIFRKKAFGIINKNLPPNWNFNIFCSNFAWRKSIIFVLRKSFHWLTLSLCYNCVLYFPFPKSSMKNCDTLHHFDLNIGIREDFSLRLKKQHLMNFLSSSHHFRSLDLVLFFVVNLLLFLLLLL